MIDRLQIYSYFYKEYNIDEICKKYKHKFFSEAITIDHRMLSMA